MKKYSNDGNKFIKLDDVYSIEPDAFNGVILKFSEVRERKKKDGTKENYDYEEETYHPNLSSALTTYLKTNQGKANTIEELLEVSKRIEEFLTNLRN